MDGLSAVGPATTYLLLLLLLAHIVETGFGKRRRRCRPSVRPSVRPSSGRTSLLQLTSG